MEKENELWNGGEQQCGTTIQKDAEESIENLNKKCRYYVRDFGYCIKRVQTRISPF